MRFFSFFLIFLIISGCTAQPPKTTGILGFENSHRVVIIGENVKLDVASYYQKKYAALVWFTPYEGNFTNKTNNFFQSGLGPSIAMRSLIRELKSINYTFGQWELIVPSIAESYFLAALKNMESHSLSKARGVVVLIDSMNNKDIEAQIKRVTDGYFFVSGQLNSKEN